MVDPPFDISHLHQGEQNRIRSGQLNPHEREMLDRGEDPWAKFRGPTRPTKQDKMQALRDEVDRASRVMGQATELLHRKAAKPPTPSIDTLKVVATVVLGLGSPVAAIATAYQQAGIVSVGLAHLILLVGWLCCLGSTVLLEHVLALPQHQRIKVLAWVALISGVIMFGADRFMVYLKAQQTGKATIQSPSQSPESIAAPVIPESEERIFIDITPEQLVGYYKKYNTVQADDVVKTHIGKWVKISGLAVTSRSTSPWTRLKVDRVVLKSGKPYTDLFLRIMHREPDKTQTQLHAGVPQLWDLIEKPTGSDWLRLAHAEKNVPVILLQAPLSVHGYG